MSDTTPPNQINKITYLKDYQPPAWLVKKVDLHLVLDEEKTEVTATLTLQRNRDLPRQILRLDGHDLCLQSIMLDGQTLDKNRYQVSDSQLLIEDLADHCQLQTVVTINPKKNTSLMGVYQSAGSFCSQCEPEGFRKITYFPDRPDVLAIFTTTLLADQTQYPVLLANGNLQKTGVLEPDHNGRIRHFCVWHDPHPKPCYLFALVAGQLACIQEQFTTQSGRLVEINFYVKTHHAHQCGHAMRCLINAMRWDEQHYGREYDLDVFNVVAIDDFNMGAMENKGLNLFNAKYVLADPDTATDTDYQHIESTIAHEYFHNWSGNRVTCRDWFQLSLKEGFTVFRDQQFSADMSIGSIKRIRDVQFLRNHQFREDATPMAHPVRPEHYLEINNFYTVTVYEKGAEIVRMLYHLLGPDHFRKASDLYFSRHDGQAVTTDDFIQAMEEADGQDLEQFRLWYRIAGTPVLTVSESFAHNQYQLSICQHIPDTPGQCNKPPLHIPIKLGLLNDDGKPLPVNLLNEPPTTATSRTLHLRKPQQQFTFGPFKTKPIASLLRQCSAPVKLERTITTDELVKLMIHDPDPFNRWDAAQTLTTRLILRSLDENPVTGHHKLLGAFQQILTSSLDQPGLIAEILRLPADSLLINQCPLAQPQKIHCCKQAWMTILSQSLHNNWRQCYKTFNTSSTSLKADAMGQRALANLSLTYLMTPPRALIDQQIINYCVEQYQQANSMTHTMAALSCLVNLDDPIRFQILDDFYHRWKNNTLVLDKWFSVQATSTLPGTLDQVKKLMQHPAFSVKNPNKVRALIGAFSSNPVYFHASDGSGYQWLADCIIEIDRFNPQIASRLTNVFSNWQQYAIALQGLMRAQLQRIQDSDPSKDVLEVASQSLKVTTS